MWLCILKYEDAYAIFRFLGFSLLRCISTFDKLATNFGMCTGILPLSDSDANVQGKQGCVSTHV